MKNNDIDAQFKKFIREMLKPDESDLKYIRDMLNLDIKTNEGEPYLRLICRDKRKTDLLANLMETVSYSSKEYLKNKTRSQGIVRDYIHCKQLEIIKADKNHILLTRFSNYEVMNFGDVQHFSYTALHDLPKYPQLFIKSKKET